GSPVHSIGGRQSTITLANDSAGTTIVDGLSRKTLGSLSSGTALDTAVSQTNLYVAADYVIYYYPNLFSLAPVIDVSKISLTHDPAGALVTGADGAVTGGNGAMTVVITNSVTGVTVNGVTLTPAGGFSTTIAAKSSELLTITVTDSAAVSVGPLSIGALISEK